MILTRKGVNFSRGILILSCRGAAQVPGGSYTALASGPTAGAEGAQSLARRISNCH